MKSIILLCFVVLLAALAKAQSDIIPAINGWNRIETNGIVHFSPANSNNKIDYYIMPPVKDVKVNDLLDWIKQQGLNDIKNASWTDLGTGKSQVQGPGSYYITTVKDQQGKKLIVMYLAYLRKDAAIRWAKIFYPATNTSNTNVTIAGNHLGTLAKAEIGNNNTVANDGSRNTTNNTAPIRHGTSASSNIKGVAMHSESTTGVGGIVGFVVRPYLFFNDGSFYGLLDTDPYGINPAVSRRQNPKKWGTWRLNGTSVEIRWDSDGSTSEWTSSKWSWAEPAAKGEKIAGSFSSISGSGNTAYGGSSFAMSSKYITFNRNGQFTFESVGGGGYSGVGGSNSAWSNRNTAGTYILDGYSIELRFNNGKVTRNGFNFYDDKKDMLSIGSSIYILSK